MPAPASAPAVTFQIAEEGEAIGTVQQFADRLCLSPSAVLTCLRDTGPAPIVLRTEQDGRRLLLVPPEGLDALRSCADDAALS
jgi:hypothetical protein